LGQLFRLDRASAAALGGDVRAGLQGSFPVPPYSAVLEHLEIATRIQVFGPHELRERQSSLTLPLFVKHARVRPESELHYRYELVPRPRWVFEYERRPEGLETQLPDPWEASPAGLLHLPRLWHRTQLQKHRPRDASDRVRVRALLSSVPADEWELDQQLFVGLGVELQAGMARLFSAHTLPDLEAWLLSQRADLPQHQLIAQVNQGLRARLERSGG
jgi:hypothetical protein